jgi:tRNA U38,U39,U40 pseudouridine synthase TruA
MCSDVAIREAGQPRWVPSQFDAISRTYILPLLSGGGCSGGPASSHCTGLPGPWDADAVDEVLGGLTGLHSFGEFAQAGSGDGSLECDLSSARQIASGREVGIEFTANRFLRNMICRLASAIALVAAHKVSPGQVLAALGGPRDFRHQPAPAKGLTLTRVDY